jgi:hypothetical protein
MGDLGGAVPWLPPRGAREAGVSAFAPRPTLFSAKLPLSFLFSYFFVVFSQKMRYDKG